jgi:DNA polymerase-3 subunit delta'
MPFRDVHGHRRLIELLSHSIQRGTLPPSLIFAGPAGVGKRLTAIAVAQAVNCPDSCGKCAACVRIARGVHPDVLLVGPGESGSIKVDQIRDVIEQTAFRPFEGRRRVVIIDDADALVAAAQNALLKTLEEPPSASMFILITSRPDMLLPTVRSRCPLLRFGPLSEAEIAAALRAQGRSDAEARAVAAASDGSLGRALDASAGELVETRTAAERVLVAAGSIAEPRRRIEVAKDLLVKIGSGTDREELASLLRAMSSLLRDAALLAARGDVHALANADVRPVLDKLAAAYGRERSVRAFASVDRAIEALTRNAGVKVVADWLVLQL